MYEVIVRELTPNVEVGAAAEAEEFPLLETVAQQRLVKL
jgi:hypothetical protein